MICNYKKSKQPGDKLFKTKYISPLTENTVYYTYFLLGKTIVNTNDIVCKIKAIDLDSTNNHFQFEIAKINKGFIPMTQEVHKKMCGYLGIEFIPAKYYLRDKTENIVELY